MRCRGLLLGVCCWLILSAVSLPAGPSTPHDTITVAPSSTSIYIGKVTLHVSPLNRQNAVYSGTYKASVFPYFFMGEHGTFRMAVSDEDLARVARGETVEFSGQAENSAREVRKVTGRAVPDDAVGGKIKVRIFVTEKIQLVFNTTYRFSSPAAPASLIPAAAP